MIKTPKHISKKILRYLYIGVFTYIGFSLFIFFIQKDLLFFPEKWAFTIPKEPNLHEIFIQTEDNVRLNAWFLDTKSDKTVLFFHGNGGNVGNNQERLEMFNQLHLNALMVDYRGYGKSEWAIENEKDMYIDANAAYTYLLKKGIKSQDIIIWGQSLGGAIAIDLTQNKDVYATVIESTFTSMDGMARTIYPFLPTTLLLQFHFKNDEKIGNITSPILVIHSRDDTTIAFPNGEKLFTLAKNPKTFLETKGSHNGGFRESYDSYVKTLKAFL